MGEMLERIKQGVYTAEETIVFWHTGGTAGLFPCATELLEGGSLEKKD
jgi:1-aminocyclopropane-1-carboxylate deaminase/D-cysteine desulfhydrase-like pyridoxal-dependent ACC family enzyme